MRAPVSNSKYPRLVKFRCHLPNISPARLWQSQKVTKFTVLPYFGGPSSVKFRRNDTIEFEQLPTTLMPPGSAMMRALRESISSQAEFNSSHHVLSC